MAWEGFEAEVKDPKYWEAVMRDPARWGSYTLLEQDRIREIVLAEQAKKTDLAKRAPKTSRDFISLVQLGIGGAGAAATLYFQVAPGVKWRRLSTIITAALTIALLIVAERRRAKPKVLVTRAALPTTAPDDTSPDGQYSGPVSDLAEEIAEYEEWLNNPPWED